jgi:hypothetical protein
MEIQNKTAIPNKILKPLVEHAFQATKCKKDGVTVKINHGKSLHGDACSSKEAKIVLPFTNAKGWNVGFEDTNEYAFAKKVYLLMVHELAHVSDFQSGYEDMIGRKKKDIFTSEKRATDVAIAALLNISIEPDWLVLFADWIRWHRTYFKFQ